MLEEIYSGWKNLIFQSPAIEAEAKRRISICVLNECKNFTKSKTCALCGCYMPAKVRSPKSRCGLKYW